MFIPVRSHHLKVLMYESKVLYEIITTSTTKKGVVKGLIQMIDPKPASVLSSQVVVHNDEKYVETLCMDEDPSCSDEYEEFKYENNSSDDFAASFQ